MFRAFNLITILLLTSVAQAQAEEAIIEEPPTKKWTVEGGLGLVINNGNTNNQNLNANVQFEYAGDAWTHRTRFDATNTEEEDDVTGERYLLLHKSSYDFSELTYVFGALRYDKDRFSGFDYQASISGGIGWHFIRQERQTFDFELGAGYKESEQNEAPFEKIDEVIFRIAGGYMLKITENTEFTQGLLVEIGESNTSTDSETALAVSMTDKLALRLAYIVRHNSDPPAGNTSMDRRTTVNLIFKF